MGPKAKKSEEDKAKEKQAKEELKKQKKELEKANKKAAKENAKAGKSDKKDVEEVIIVPTKSTRVDDDDLEELKVIDLSQPSRKSRKLNDGQFQIAPTQALPGKSRRRDTSRNSRAVSIMDSIDDDILQAIELDVDEDDLPSSDDSSEEFKESKPKRKKSEISKQAKVEASASKKRGKDGKVKEAKREKPKPKDTQKSAKVTEKDKKKDPPAKAQIGKAKEKEKQVIMDVPDTKKTIEEYLNRHNRPYSLQDILNSYQSTMRKKPAETALEQLVKAKTVTLKEYGKAKVYLINQDRFPEVDPALLDSLDEQVNQRRAKHNELTDKSKALDRQLKENTSSLTNGQLKAQIEKLQTENEQIGTKLEGFKSGGIKLISEEELNTTFKEQAYYFQQWKKTKRGCKEMMDIISEQADINLKEFIKKLGLETDEDYGVNIDQIQINK